jgi:hypothetical protein
MKLTVLNHTPVKVRTQFRRLPITLLLVFHFPFLLSFDSNSDGPVFYLVHTSENGLEHGHITQRGVHMSTSCSLRPLSSCAKSLFIRMRSTISPSLPSTNIAPMRSRLRARRACNNCNQKHLIVSIERSLPCTLDTQNTIASVKMALMKIDRTRLV